MKKVLLSVLLILNFCGTYAQKNTSISYYYKGSKVYYPTSNDRLIVGMEPGYSFAEFKIVVANDIGVSTDSLEEIIPNSQFLVRYGRNNQKDISGTITRLQQHPWIQFARPVFVTPSGNYNSYGTEFIVKLKPGTKVTAMKKLMETTGCSMIKKYPFQNDIYILTAGLKSNYDGLKMANVFYESGLFDYAEPNKIVHDALHISLPNDPLYNLQWGHKNTGVVGNGATIGADMKVPEAWEVTMGNPYIKIGVIDEGVDLTHPDLQANLLQGFNGATLTSNPGDGAPLRSAGAHGTNCAGIIGAVANNNIGIAGIAPKCKIIPATIFGSTGAYLGDAAVAASFDYVRLAGADVISNSWGGGSVSSTIDAAINRAVTLGRFGKGCVVLFSSGNNNTSAVGYPANNSQVISVGGVNMCGQRKSGISAVCDGENFWGSNYGNGLDVVAPSVKIATTDIQGSAGYNNSAGTAGDYNTTFNGTSSACPNAAGVAALILSVDSSLSVAQATQILALSCDKLAAYTYTPNNDSNQPYGTWNEETGHGRVNAFTAVQMAGTGNYCSVQLLASATQFCNGPIVLSINNPDPGATYQIRKDGIVVFSGIAYTTASIGNYDATIVKGNCHATSNTISLINRINLSVSASLDSVCAGGNTQLNAVATYAPINYCTPTYSVGTVEGDYISHVSIATTTLNNTTTGAANPFYTVFPQAGTTTATLSANSTYTLSVKGGTYAECYIRAWIDYNHDGLFDSPNESIGISANVGNQSLGTIVFTVPAGAVNGTTRLRLRSTDDSNGPGIATSCNATTSGYGEAEDYIITINDGVPPFTYSWIESPTGSTLVATNTAQVDASNINQTTTYSATATSGSGCVISSDIVITSKAVSIGSITAASNPICKAGGSTLLTANSITGSYPSTNWFTGPKGTGVNVGTGITLANAVANKTYYALVTGSCDDTTEKSITLLSDKTPPTITCPANITANNTIGCSKALSIADPVYSDNCAIKSLTWKLSGATVLSSGTSGIRLAGRKTFNNGISILTYTITDSSSNKASCMTTVTLSDIVKPIFTHAVANIVDSVQTGCSKSISIPVINFSDNCGTPTLSWTATGSTNGIGTGQIGSQLFNAGKTTVTYTIVDAQTNRSSVRFTVTVLDKLLPNINCPSTITQNTNGTNCFKFISTPAPVFSDNCKIKSLLWKMTGATISSSGTTGIKLLGSRTFNAGLTNVTYLVTDSASNTNSCLYHVQVNSNIACTTFSRETNLVSETTTEGLKVKVTPNPTKSFFVMTVQSNVDEAVEISVFDAVGKKIQNLKKISQKNIQIGEKYKAGNYFFEVRQGEKRTTAVGVKQ